MPKKVYTPRQLPPEQPDCCERCPLVGIIPKEERRSGVRERYYCLGIYGPEFDENGNPVTDENGCQLIGFPRIKTKGIRNSAKAWKAKGHLLHRPCDNIWDAWMTLPGKLLGIPTDTYIKYRIPFEQEQMTKNMPRFPFRKPRARKVNK
jgi:hypothetical protein